MTNKLLTSIIIILLGSVVGMSIVFHKSPIIGTEAQAEEKKDDITTRIFTTKAGSTITIKNSHPTQESKSTVTITTEGFENNDELTIEDNKLTDTIFSDINNDAYEELILVFTEEGESKESAIRLFTTHNNSSLVELDVPTVNNETMAPGGPFEGYLGYDTFSIKKSKLVHEFKTSTLGTPITKKKPRLELIKTQEEKANNQGDTATSTSYNKNREPFVLGESTTTEQQEGGQDSDTLPEETASDQTTSTEPETFTRALAYTLLDSDSSFVVELEEFSSSNSETSISSQYQLYGTVWEWLSGVGENNEVLTPKTQHTFILSFSTPQEFVIKTDCGELTGTYISGDGFISLGNLQAQEKECPSTSQEKTYKELLLSATGYSVRGDKLFLTLPGDKVMIFSK